MEGVEIFVTSSELEEITSLLEERYSYKRNGTIKFHLTPTEQKKLGVSNAELNNVVSPRSHTLTYLRARMLRKGWSIEKTDYKFWNKKSIDWS
jgi:hypothetical protein